MRILKTSKWSAYIIPLYNFKSKMYEIFKSIWLTGPNKDKELATAQLLRSDNEREES